MSSTEPVAQDKAQPSTDDDRERLRQHFLGRDPSVHGGAWNELWVDDFKPWDKGGPSPALIDLLNDRRELTGGISIPVDPESTSSIANRRRRRAFVPGCGAGYDVLLLASYGYDAYGLELSEVAVERCLQYQQEHGHEYAARDPDIGSGNVKFLAGDFFKKDWEAGVDGGIGDGFELIYDYTFLCALPPSIRHNWSLRMSQLLGPASPNCTLICLEFPTYKSPSLGGPPWSAPSVVYRELLTHPGEELEFDGEGVVVPRKESKGNDKALVQIAHWKAERTHKIGEGTDCVGVWRQKSKEAESV